MKHKMDIMDLFVYISMTAIIAYTIPAFVLQFLGLMEISPTLTISWYGFWTTEIVLLASLKSSKNRHKAKEYIQLKHNLEHDDYEGGNSLESDIEDYASNHQESER